MIQRGHLTDDVPATGEAFHELLSHPHARVEHIVSSDAPDDVVYDQDDDELVVLLRGSARLEVEQTLVDLEAGDHVFLPAHTVHRVVQTTRGAHWLAIFLPATGTSPRRPR